MTQTAGEKLDQATSAVHSAFDNASGKASVAGTQAAEWVQKQGGRLAAAPQKFVDDTSGYISANPLKSLGIAVVAALLVGRLMR